MRTDTAINLISRLVYIPGWSFSARDHTNRFEDAVKVHVDFPARSSEREQAAEGYPNKICTYVEFPMLVGDCESAEDLVFCLMVHVLLRLNIHEMREFLRLPDTLWAPFHPHRKDGMKRWAEYVKSVDVATVLGGILRDDLLYGV